MQAVVVLERLLQRVEATVLREAFDRAVKSPEFIADAAKRGLELAPKDGPELDDLFQKYGVPTPEIAARVARVVVATPDTNAVASGGADRLRAAGIEVQSGLMADEARELGPEARPPPPDAGACARDADVLTGEAAADEVDGLEVLRADLPDVLELRDVGPVLLEDLAQRD